MAGQDGWFILVGQDGQKPIMLDQGVWDGVSIVTYYIKNECRNNSRCNEYRSNRYPTLPM